MSITLIVLTNLKTFLEWAGLGGGTVGLAAFLWALVWAHLIVVAVRAEQRVRRLEAARTAEGALSPA